MALLLQQSDPTNGAVTTYLRIDGMVLPASFRVGYYVDSTTAITKAPVRTELLMLSADESTRLNSQVASALYSIIKSRDAFKMAQDV